MEQVLRFGALVLATALVALGSPSALASRPLATDDGDILDARACEWESFASHQGGSDGTASAWQTQLTCGVGHGLQLASSLSSVKNDGDRANVVGLGGKLRLYSDGAETNSLRAAVSAGVDMLQLDGAGYQIQDNAINLIVSQSFDTTWTAHANLGMSHSRMEHVSRATWNLALERAVGHDVDVMGEVFGDNRDSRPWLGTGVRWSPADTSSSFNVAFSVHGANASRLTSIGYKLSF